MTLLQCGVKDGNKIMLFVKDASKAENSAPISVKTNESFTSKLDLKKELYPVLIRHFMPSDAQRVAEQFLYVSWVDSCRDPICSVRNIINLMLYKNNFSRHTCNMLV